MRVHFNINADTVTELYKSKDSVNTSVRKVILNFRVKKE